MLIDFPEEPWFEGTRVSRMLFVFDEAEPFSEEYWELVSKIHFTQGARR